MKKWVNKIGFVGKMSRLASLSAVILLITYNQFCTAQITVEDDADAQATERLNTQSSEEWFDPIKQTQNQTFEDVIRLFTPKVMSKIIKYVPDHIEAKETDEIEAEYSGETSTTQKQDVTKSVDGQYETTKFSERLMNEAGDMPQLPTAAELLSSKGMFMHDTLPTTVSQSISENNINERVVIDQKGSMNISLDSTNKDHGPSVEKMELVSLVSPRPKPKPKPKIHKYKAEEILRRFLDDTYIRKPMAALIDTSPNALRKTKALWKSALKPNSPLNIVLVAFNSSGIHFFK